MQFFKTEKIASFPAQLFLISGPSGVGKSTLILKLMEQNPELVKLVSYTTRSPRPGEREGFTYHYVSLEHYKNMEKKGEFHQSTEFDGFFYGYRKTDILDNLQKGKTVLADMDYRALPFLKALAGKVLVSMLILPSASPEEYEILLRQRLSRRGDSDESIERRMSGFKVAAFQEHAYDHVIINQENALAETLGCLQDLMREGVQSSAIFTH